MEADKTSKMWESYTLDTVDGETAFRYAKSDESAERTVDAYIEKLAYGITNVANIFRPDVILLGGGICGEGKSLTEPLRHRLASEIYAGDMGPAVEIKIAELGNRAGILGAAALIMD
jgi:glucokinase